MGLRLALLAFLAALSVAQESAPGGGSLDPDSLRATGLHASPRFIPNLGQFEERVRYVVPGRGLSAWVERDALVLHKRDAESGRGVVLRFLFEEASPDLRWTEAEPRPGHSSFFLGPDPERWQRRVPGYRKVIAEEFRPGVALELELHSGLVWYALRAEPGAVMTSLSVRVEGAAGLSLEPDGSVLVDTALGALRHTAPLAWEEDASGIRRAVGVSARVSGLDRIVLEVTGRDPARALVVDPGLNWSTYLGGTGYERMAEAGWHPDGHVTVGGITSSLDFPVTAGAYDTEHGGLGQLPWDVCVTRFLPDGSDLNWSTYLGGPQNEGIGGMKVLGSGEVIVGGWSGSFGMPVTPGAFHNPGSSPFFVVRLTATGDELVYSAVWGPGGTQPHAFVDVDETVVIAAENNKNNYPTTPGALMPTKPSTFTNANDVVISRLSADGTHLVASTYLGGSISTWSDALTLRPDGSVVVVGSTSSPDFPVTPGAYVEGMPGGFVTCLDPLLTKVVFSTGTGGADTTAVACDASGAVVRVGFTESPAPPSTPGAFQPVDPGGWDAFVQRFTPDGTGVQGSTFLGGIFNDQAKTVTVDSAGTMTVVGYAESPGYTGFPVTPGAIVIEPTSPGLFISRISPDATALWYSTVLSSQTPSGNFGDWTSAPAGIDLDDEGGVIVVGQTQAGDFPTSPNAFDPVGSTGGPLLNPLPADGIVIRLTLLPHGVKKYGTSTPGCAGKHAIGVTAQPRVGSTSFGLTCTNAEPFAAGLAVISQAPAAGPLHVQGAQLLVDPTKLLAALPVTANELGALILPLRIPEDAALAGQTFYTQLLWRETCASPPSLSASNALSLTVQP